MSTIAAMPDVARRGSRTDWAESFSPPRTRASTDARRFVEETIAAYPVVTVGAAIAAGMVLGWFIKRA